MTINAEEIGLQQEEDFYAALIKEIHKLSKDGYTVWPSEQMVKIRNLANKKVKAY